MSRPTFDPGKLLQTLALAGGVGLLVGAAAAAPDDQREQRLRGMREEIDRLSAELAQLEGQERGVLGELERLSIELELQRAEVGGVRLELDDVTRRLGERNEQLGVVEQAQSRRYAYLVFRLREIYRAGRARELRLLAGGGDVERYLEGLRYAAYLSERDARTLTDYRADARRLVAERDVLAADRERLAGLEAELATRQARLDRTRRQQQQKLNAIREDRGQRREAILELEAAASELSRLVGTLDAAGPDLDMRKFRGLLEWPADGEVTAGFGTVVHPRFKTRVPHPGLDIAGASGSDIRAVFDGEVMFAAWMRGYGLTAIVDHGGGLLSIYAHASVLLVEPGQRLRRGQSLGKIGETGSLKGPFLYFELRVGGEPSDPTDWLEPRSP